MYEWLGRISPKTRILFFASLLILLPSAFLSYLGLQSVNEKMENLRAHYRSTTGLVKDKIERELLRDEDGIRTFILKSELQSASTQDIQTWLKDLQQGNTFLEHPIVVNEVGGILSTIISKGWTTPKPVSVPANAIAAKSFAAAEAAEFATADFNGTLKLYRAALQSAAAVADRALILARIGRCEFKLRRFQDGIKEYKKILALKDHRLLIGSLPASVVALSQIADGYQSLGDTLNYRRHMFALYQVLVHDPWDIADGQYLFYLKIVHDADSFFPAGVPERGELEKQEETIRSQEIVLNLIAENLIPKISSDAEFGAVVDLQPHHFVIPTVGVSHQLGFVKLPTLFRIKGIVSLGYQYRPQYLTTELFPRALKSADLEPGFAVGVLDEQDNVVYVQGGLLPLNHLAAEKFPEMLPSWKVVLFDRQGRSVEALVGSERTLYLSLFIGIVLVMALGIFVTVRAAAHEAEASKLKADFVSNVSHDLKTPLALIRMFGETLESGLVVDEAKRKEFYGIIRKESERLTHLINNVLDFSRMDAGTRRYQFEDADVAELVRSTTEAYRYHIRDLGFELESILPAEPLFATIDKDAISQAVLNLLDNATKYSRSARFIRVLISRAGEAIVISVEDHGVGIPKEFQERIFDKFYRMPGENTSETRGSGLGLALTKHIVEAHGGTIEVECATGKGSIFSIKIPIRTS